MANLNVENLNAIVRSGDVEGMFGATTIPQQPGPGAEKRALEELGAGGGEAASKNLAGPNPAEGKTFSEILSKSFETVNDQQHEADQAIRELVSGRTKNIHETMLTIERADASLKLAMQVRNKILDAYREIMRMQV
jgi:flagellar hook-basal body complex protein FliE